MFPPEEQCKASKLHHRRLWRLSAAQQCQSDRDPPGSSLLHRSHNLFRCRCCAQVLNKFCTLAPGVLSMLIFLGPMAWAHSDVGILLGCQSTKGHQNGRSPMHTADSLSAAQLLNEYSPIAAGFLGVLIPIFEPVGWAHAEPGTLLGYQYSAAAIVAIAVSAGLGLLVSLSTFLVIGATSSLTYNVVGHIKTVIILMGGCMFFGDQMPLKKLAGISIAMSGIIWYSQVSLLISPPPACSQKLSVCQHALLTAITCAHSPRRLQCPSSRALCGILSVAMLPNNLGCLRIDAWPSSRRLTRRETLSLLHCLLVANSADLLVQLKLQQVAQASREKLPTYLPVPTSETNGAAINGHFGGNHEGSVTKTSSRSSSIKTADLK